MNAAQREHAQDAELARLRELVIDQGETIAALMTEVRRLQGEVRLVALATGVPLPDFLPDRPQREPTPAAAPADGYAAAALVQACRRSMHAVTGQEAAR
jgi:hypothetical protein